MKPKKTYKGNTLWEYELPILYFTQIIFLALWPFGETISPAQKEQEKGRIVPELR